MEWNDNDVKIPHSGWRFGLEHEFFYQSETIRKSALDFRVLRDNETGIVPVLTRESESFFLTVWYAKCVTVFLDPNS
jgi:hypothetical protein